MEPMEKFLAEEVGRVLDQRFSDMAEQLLSFGDQHRDHPESLARELDNLQAAQEWLHHQAMTSPEKVPSENQQGASRSPEEIARQQTALWGSMRKYLKAMEMGDFVRIALEHLGIRRGQRVQAASREYGVRENELKQEMDNSLANAREAYERIQQARKRMEELFGTDTDSEDETDF